MTHSCCVLNGNMASACALQIHVSMVVWNGSKPTWVQESHVSLKPNNQSSVQADNDGLVTVTVICSSCTTHKGARGSQQHRAFANIATHLYWQTCRVHDTTCTNTRQAAGSRQHQRGVYATHCKHCTPGCKQLLHSAVEDPH